MTRTKRIPTLDSPSLTLRAAGPEDADELRRLAALDSASVPQGELLVAEVGGSLWAAVSLEDHQAIADPFRPTGELLFLLHERARDTRSRSSRSSWSGRLRPIRALPAIPSRG